MHHINAANKRKHTIRLFSAYTIIGVVIVGVTFILLQVALGYDIDRKTGQVIQNGALLLETVPEEATIYLNDQLERDKTPSQLPLPEGDYALRLELDGYRSWQSDVIIGGSEVTWLYYPQLIPNTVNTASIDTYQNIRFYEIDDESDQIVVYDMTNKKQLTLYNITDKEIVPIAITLPDVLFELADDGELLGGLSFIEWSSDSRFMLLRYTHDNTDEIILVDVRNPQRSQNVTTELNRSIDTAFFGPRNNEVYAVIDTSITEYNVGDRALQDEVFFENALQIATEDRFIWALRQSETTASVYRADKTDAPVIQRMNETGIVMLVSNYEASPTVALVRASSVELFTDISEDLLENVPEKIIQFGGANPEVQFSQHGRFLSVMTDEVTTVYDLESQRTYTIAAPSRILGWLDAQRLYYELDEQLHILDFTGENDFQISGFDSTRGVYVDKDRKGIFTVGANSVSDRLVLRRSALVAEP